MERCYFATMLALIVHQIDAAYWHEWEMFAVPGGTQGFLVFNGVQSVQSYGDTAVCYCNDALRESGPRLAQSWD